MFCRNCGRQMGEGERFCSHCGQGVDAPPGGMQGGVPHWMADRARYEILHDLARKEKVSYRFWLVLGLLQVGMGWLLSLFGWWMVVVGVLNILHAVEARQFARSIGAGLVGGNETIERYQNGLFGMLLVAAYNVAIGGVIGAAVSVWEFHIRGFVMKNKYQLMDLPPYQAAQGQF